VVELGRLEHLPAREVWPNEARDFTPWLLANGDHLAEALGTELEFRVAEHPVGGFSLDLMGRDLARNNVLIVENQLGGTDHVHLGQILTYAAGTDAATIVWVATAFREEHRQALDWLNEKTVEDVRFFGVQVSVVRIGESPPAPVFEVVAKPNDWQKQVRTAARSTSTTGKAEQYRRFWTRYLERVRTEHPTWGRRSTPQPANWMRFSSPIPGTEITPSFAAHDRLRHELYIDNGDAEDNARLFNELLTHQAEIEAAYGRPLEFEELVSRRACRVAEYAEGSVTEESAWASYIDWFVDCGVRLRRALATFSQKPV
jgi:hypothetical protein